MLTVGAGGAQAARRPSRPPTRRRWCRASGRRSAPRARLVGRERLRAVERRRQRAARQRRRGARPHEQHERGQQHDEPAGAVGAGPEQRGRPRRARRIAAHAREARPALARGTLGEHRVRVCMTARDGAVTRPATGSRPRLRCVSASRGTILVIDDEDAVQRLVRFPLEREGYRVLGAVERRGRTAAGGGRAARSRAARPDAARDGRHRGLPARCACSRRRSRSSC